LIYALDKPVGLTTDWVSQVLGNLAAVRGWEWLESRARSSLGLMPHRSDAG